MQYQIYQINEIFTIDIIVLLKYNNNTNNFFKTLFREYMKEATERYSLLLSLFERNYISQLASGFINSLAFSYAISLVNIVFALY